MRVPIMLVAMALAARVYAGDALYGRVAPDGHVYLSDTPQDGYRPVLRRAAVRAPAVSSDASVSRVGRCMPDTLARIGREENVPPALLHAVVAVESSCNPTAVSVKGARGLMQLMPATASRYGVTRVFDPADNVRGGARYLRDLLARFAGRTEVALAAYNAGEEAVARHANQVPPFDETRSYVHKVLTHYERLNRDSIGEKRR